MDDSDADKIFPPTPRRREQARREGRFPHSRSLASALTLLVFFLALRHGGHYLWQGLESIGLELWARGAWIRVDEGSPVESSRSSLMATAITLSPWLLLLLGLAAATQFLQIGFQYRPERLTGGGSRLFSGGGSDLPERLGDTCWKLGQFLVVGFVAFRSLATRMHDWAAITNLPLTAACQQLADETLTVGLHASGTLVAMGLIDFAWRWWRHEQSLWMTREELQEEMKSEAKASRPRTRSTSIPAQQDSIPSIPANSAGTR